MVFESQPECKLEKKPLFLYGASIFPLAWIANFIFGSLHLERMKDIPLIETVTNLSVLLGLFFALLAWWNRERPRWLAFLSFCLYAYLFIRIFV
jgi:hypothetical protein